jgi:hypothetical protein
MDAQMEFLTGRVKAQRDITMPERAAPLLAARGVKANPAPLSRVFCRAGFACKKDSSWRRSASTPTFVNDGGYGSTRASP